MFMCAEVGASLSKGRADEDWEGDASAEMRQASGC